MLALPHYLKIHDKQQICANLRNVYIRCQYFVLPCRTSSGLLCFSKFIRFEFLSSCPHSPNAILVTKTALRLMNWENWIYHILRAKIIYNLVEQGKAPTPSSEA